MVKLEMDLRIFGRDPSLFYLGRFPKINDI